MILRHSLLLLLACLALGLTSCFSTTATLPQAQLLMSVSIDGVPYTKIPANLNLAGGRDINISAEPLSGVTDLRFHWAVGKGKIFNPDGAQAVWTIPSVANSTVLGLQVEGSTDGTTIVQQQVAIRMTY